MTGAVLALARLDEVRTLLTYLQWLLNWAIAYATPYLVNYGPGYANLQSKIFFIWFACCFLCITFVYFLIYETKGLSLEEIDELYTEVSSARKSTHWQPTKTFKQRESVAAKDGVLTKDSNEHTHKETVGERPLEADPIV